MELNRNKPQFIRLIALDQAIRDGKYPNALTFSTHWETSQKTVQRDIEFLRDSLAAPIEYDRVRKGYYYTDKSWFLPAVTLSESELLSLLLARRVLEQYKGTPISKELSGVIEKIAANLTDKFGLKPKAIFERFSFTLPAAKEVQPEVWQTITQAVIRQQSVWIKYHSLNSNQTTERVVDPYHVANLHGEWYVLARCHKAKELRQFGIPQIREVRLTGKYFARLPGLDPEDSLSNAFRRQALGGKTHTVKLLFDPEIADRVVERIWHPKQKVRRLRHGSVELSFPAVGLLEVSRWVLSWGHRVKVIRPLELKKMLEDELRLIAKTLGGL